MQSSMSEFIAQYKSQLSKLYILIGFIEAVILIFCWVASWDQSYVAVINPQGKTIYEAYFYTSGSQIRKAKEIININRETNRSPGNEATPNASATDNSDGYTMINKEIRHEFPVRAWVAASISVPIALILLGAFIVRVYQELLFDEAKQALAKRQQHESGFGDFDENLLDNATKRISSLNIFLLGGIIFLVAVLFWLIPDLLIKLSQISMDLMAQHSWIVISVVSVIVVLIIMRSIMRHRMNMEIIRQQADIQKKRDELSMQLKMEGRPSLEDNSNHGGLIIDGKGKPYHP